MSDKKTPKILNIDLDDELETIDGAAEKIEQIKISAEINADRGRALDPQSHDPNAARDIAVELCSALTKSYGRHDDVRPETLAVAIQTVLETLISSIEREGVSAASMRVALANSMLVNGDAAVEIEVDGERVPSMISESSSSIH